MAWAAGTVLLFTRLAIAITFGQAQYYGMLYEGDFFMAGPSGVLEVLLRCYVRSTECFPL